MFSVTRSPRPAPAALSTASRAARLLRLACGAAAIVATATAATSGSRVPGSAPRPNVIVIMADDLGFSDLGSYGSEIATPHLDRLAREGLRYTQFYNTSRCCPSRASLMTGLYPHQAGVGHMVDVYAQARRDAFASPAYTDRLDPRTPTIAEALQPAGYRTFMVGKWHLGYRPEEWPAARGFERSFVMIEGAMNFYGPGPQHSLPQGERGTLPMAVDDRPFTPPAEGFFTTDAFTDRAIEYVRDARRRAAPFFLYFAHNAPHWPLHARPATIAKYRGNYLAGWDRLRAERHARLQQLGAIDPRWPLAPRPENLPAWENVPAERRATWDTWMAIYAAQIEEMDTSIGRLLDALRETGAADNTLVLFFSDNGGAAERPVKTIGQPEPGSRDHYEGYAIDGAHVSSAPFRKTKKFTHEGGISSPLIAWWPAGIPAARRGQWVRDPAHLIDIMATCLDLAGTTLPASWRGAVPKTIEGVSLAPTFAGRPLARSQPLFWEHEGHRAVRDGDWKLVSTHGGPWELYRMSVDRTEMNDLAAAQPERVQALSARYEAWARTAGVKPWTNLAPPAKKKK
jgi:arylsulfatase